MAGYIERSARLEKGIQSEYFNAISDIPGTVTEEQQALMALVLENSVKVAKPFQIVDFKQNVIDAENLCPGHIQSSQIITILAMMAGIK
jgi:hypothetical protein